MGYVGKLKPEHIDYKSKPIFWGKKQIVRCSIDVPFVITAFYLVSGGIMLSHGPI